MTRKTYSADYRAQLVSLVKAGRTPESLAKEYEPSAPTIRAWVDAAQVAEAGGAPVDKDARIRELERKVKQLEEEREILKKSGRSRRSVRSGPVTFVPARRSVSPRCSSSM